MGTLSMQSKEVNVKEAENKRTKQTYQYNLLAFNKLHQIHLHVHKKDLDFRLLTFLNWCQIIVFFLH